MVEQYAVGGDGKAIKSDTEDKHRSVYREVAGALDDDAEAVALSGPRGTVVQRKGPPLPSTGDADMDNLLRKCLEILVVKGHDYTIGADHADRLHNFRTAAAFVGVTPEQALGVYMYKHIAAIFSHIKGGSESEPIAGRLADLINYALLYHKMVSK